MVRSTVKPPFARDPDDIKREKDKVKPRTKELLSQQVADEDVALKIAQDTPYKQISIKMLEDI